MNVICKVKLHFKEKILTLQITMLLKKEMF